ncbi:hypothetical protein MCEGEM3_02620 [Oxalobacteraceae bacterium]|jgi:hypothetical protein
MFRTLLVVTSLFAANAATATTSVEQSTVTNNETVMPVAAAGKSWTVISMENSKQMSKVRKFFDLGANGVQQIDYVVNCTNKTVALAGFQVLQSSENVPSGPLAVTSYDDLSFYKPKLDIDRNVANSACDKRLAQSETIQTN